MMFLYKNQIVLLKEGYYKAKLVKKIPEKNKWLAEYYDENNKYHATLITEEDIMTEEEYLVIKRRNDLINKILS
jgi:hypothetical protein